MLRKPPKSVQSLLDASHLTELQKKQTGKTHLQSLWTATVPADVNANSRFLSVQGQTLVVVTHSSVWATRIRLIQSHIMAQFSKLPNMTIRSLEVKVRPTRSFE